MKLGRRESNPKITELRDLPIFSGLAPTHLTAMAKFLDGVTIPAGERIVTAGRYNDTFWIILDGTIDLSLDGRIHETLQRGAIVGLPSMFTGHESTADAVAMTQVRALVASHQQFNSLMADPEVAIRFKASMFDRLRDEVEQLTRGSTAKKAVAKPATKAIARPAAKTATKR